MGIKCLISHMHFTPQSTSLTACRGGLLFLRNRLPPVLRLADHSPDSMHCFATDSEPLHNGSRWSAAAHSLPIVPRYFAARNAAAEVDFRPSWAKRRKGCLSPAWEEASAWKAPSSTADLKVGGPPSPRGRLWSAAAHSLPCVRGGGFSPIMGEKTKGLSFPGLGGGKCLESFSGRYGHKMFDFSYAFHPSVNFVDSSP